MANVKRDCIQQIFAAPREVVRTTKDGINTFLSELFHDWGWYVVHPFQANFLYSDAGSWVS